MRIELTTKGYNEGNRLVSVIEKKLAKLDKYLDNDAEARVKLSTVGGDKFTMEVTIFSQGEIVRAEVTTANMYDNIDILLPKLEKQITKFRSRQSGKSKKKVAFAEAPIDAPEEVSRYGKVVREKKFDISIITVEDAIEEMELLDHNFYVFVNAETNKVSVVYKRLDGDYGLITPEY